MKAYKITNRYENTLRYDITMPANESELERYIDKKLFTLTGRMITLRGTESYTTTNKIEIDFLRRLSGIRMSELDEVVKEEFIKMTPEPLVGTALTKEEARQYMYKDIAEEDIITNLKKLGYISDTSGLLKSVNDGKLVELTEELMVERLKELGWTLYKKGHIAKTKKKK